MRMLFCLLVLMVAATLSGCARNHVPSTQAPASVLRPDASDSSAIVTPASALSGKVASVNATLRFAVLTFPMGQVPAANQRLNVYRNGLKVGELLVTGPQNDESTVADILVGNAQIGDEVRAN
jgi:hypothetical protein